MTRIFTDGAEMGDTRFWSGGTVYVRGDIKRSGAYSYEGSGGHTYHNFSNISECYLRIALYWWSNTWGGGVFNLWSTDGQVFGLGLGSVNNDIAKTRAWVNNSIVATGSSILNSSEWHLFEVYFKMADNPDGRIMIYTNGVLEIDYTGDTKPGSATTFYTCSFANGWGGVCCDDLAMNNTSGAYDNSWCGDGHVEYLAANGNGDVNDWTNSAGNKTNNYTYVDDVPPNSDTDYVSASVVGLQDMYNVASFTSTNRIVKRIWGETRSKDTSYTSKGIKLGFKTGSSVYLSSASSVLAGSYSVITGDYAITSPTTGSAWTGDEINSLQFVQEAG